MAQPCAISRFMLSMFVLWHQVVIRVRPMFDVELEAGQTYAVQIAADDPHRLEARKTPRLLSA